MYLFSLVIDAVGIVRYPKGVHKQVKLYRRDNRVYLPHSGGYIEVRYKEPDGSFNTSHPDIKLLEYESPITISTEKHLGQQRMRIQG